MELWNMVQHWMNDILLWIGFGTVVGLLAKGIMPGRDPGGAITTLLLGIVGSIIGSGTLKFFWEGAHVTPISPMGFVVATAGAFLLLFCFRLLAGQYFKDAEDGLLTRPRKHRGRRAAAMVHED